MLKFMIQYNIFFVFAVLVIIDYVSGILCAVTTKELNSTTGRNGLIRKGGIILLIISTYALQFLVNSNASQFGDVSIPNFANIISICFTVNEFVSIVENMSKLGVPIPKPLVDILSKIKKDKDPI